VVHLTRRPKPSSNAAAVAKYYEAAISSARSAPKKTDRLFVSDEKGGYVVQNDVAARAIDEGLKATIVGRIVDAVSIEKGKVLGAIGIDKATLRRREAKRATLDVDEAAGVIRTAELSVMATQTFGTEERGAQWLDKPHPLLDGRSPMEYANNSYGLAKVKSMLDAIRFGGVV
jgi:putative toxin-antitoxin system antitoxin component (TIGR02293 family)